MQQEWATEAERNNVFPLLGGYDPALPADANVAPRVSAALADPSGVKRRVFRPGGSPITDEALPKFGAGGTAVAHVEPGSNRNGVLCAVGDWTQGWALYLADGRLTCCINVAGEESYATSASAIDDAATALGFRIVVREGGFDIEVLVDGDVVGAGSGTRPIPVGMQQVGGTGLCVGYDRGFPVTDRYETPNTFTGTIRYVTMDADDASPGSPAARIAQALHED